MSHSPPYLSVVATSRNDNHGGDLTRRMQIFVDALASQANRHRVEIELILVEWNPPADRAALERALQWPADSDYCEIRVITVPPEIHKAYGHSDRLPLFQMIGKNVGVRRARGQFVLQTNIDVVFSDALFGWISRRMLRPRVLYRCDRVDVSSDVPVDAPIERVLSYCETHVLRIAKRDGTWLVPPNTAPATVADARPVAPTTLSPSSSPGSFSLRERSHRWSAQTLLRMEGRADSLAMRGRLTRSRLVSVQRSLFAACVASAWLAHDLLASLVRRLGIAGLYRRASGRVRQSRVVRLLGHRVPEAVRVLRALGYRPRISEIADYVMAPRRRIPQLHTNGCGDFLLTDAQSWQRMRGTPELSVYSMYLDSLALVTAYRAGIKIQNLPSERVIYHIEHGGGWTPGEHVALYRRMNQRGIPIISYQTYLRYAQHLIGNPDYFLAPETWGLAEHDLQEVRVTRRLSTTRSDAEEGPGVVRARAHS